MTRYTILVEVDEKKLRSKYQAIEKQCSIKEIIQLYLEIDNSETGIDPYAVTKGWPDTGEYIW